MSSWKYLETRPGDEIPWIKGSELQINVLLGKQLLERWVDWETSDKMGVSLEAVREAMAWQEIPENSVLLDDYFLALDVPVDVDEEAMGSERVSLDEALKADDTDVEDDVLVLDDDEDELPTDEDDEDE